MEVLEKYNVQILETLVVLAVLVIVNVIFRKWSFRISKRLRMGIERRKITIKIVNLFLVMLGIISISGIWGLDQKELFVFLTSTVTVLGIGFFAQWSILSNITSGLIIFFNHPIHIGDTIKIIDKDYPVEGVIKDISMFFMHIETNDGENITIPNSVVTQKIVSIVSSGNGKRQHNEEQRIDTDIEDPI